MSRVGAARGEPRSEPRRDPRGPRREPLPLHGLRRRSSRRSSWPPRGWEQRERALRRRHPPAEGRRGRQGRRAARATRTTCARRGCSRRSCLRSTRTHARIARLDVSRALALPGVHAVLTGADLPIAYGILPVSQDEHALALEQGALRGRAGRRRRGRRRGDGRARARPRRGRVRGPAGGDVDRARRSPRSAAAVHEERPTNVHRAAALEFGDVDGGFEAADHVREDLFFVHGNTHVAARGARDPGGVGRLEARPCARPRRCRTTCSARSRACSSCRPAGSA